MSATGPSDGVSLSYVHDDRQPGGALSVTITFELPPRGP